MECRVLIINDNSESSREVTLVESALATELTRAEAGLQWTAKAVWVKATNNDHDVVMAAVKQNTPDLILVDGHLGYLPNDGLDVVRRLRCEAGYKGFVWIWSAHRDSDLQRLFVNVKPSLFTGYGAGTCSSAGDLALSVTTLATQVADAWAANGRTFEIHDVDFGCVDVEAEALILLNALQLGLWTEGTGRDNQWSKAKAVWAGLSTELERAGQTKAVNRCGAVLRIVTGLSGEDNARKAALITLRDELLTAIDLVTSAS